MNIVIDARWIGDTPSGIGVYTRELARRLPALSRADRFTLLFRDPASRDREIAAMGLADAPNVEAAIFPHGVFSPLSQLLLPTWLRIRHCDVFHSPNFMIPYLAFSGSRKTSAGRCVTTIHDVIPLLLPGYAPRSRKSRMMALLRACMRLTIRKSTAVLTVSDTARRDIARVFSLAPSSAAKIHPIYNGISSTARPDCIPIPHSAFRIPHSPIVLYVGRLDPYKQVPELVRAFASAIRHSSSSAKLFIVGPDDPRYPEAREMAASLDIEDRVMFLGFVPDSQLDALYREATIVVNPSRYEGFGLPILEAMAHGAPVICGDGGAQPEIAGDAARIVPSGDGQALADAISELLADPALRRTLSERGLARAASFTWDRAARETLAAYRVVGRKGSVFHSFNRAQGRKKP